jgi:hypothetical protein
VGVQQESRPLESRLTLSLLAHKLGRLQAQVPEEQPKEARDGASAPCRGGAPEQKDETGLRPVPGHSQNGGGLQTLGSWRTLGSRGEGFGGGHVATDDALHPAVSGAWQLLAGPSSGAIAASTSVMWCSPSGLVRDVSGLRWVGQGAVQWLVLQASSAG